MLVEFGKLKVKVLKSSRLKKDTSLFILNVLT